MQKASEMKGEEGPVSCCPLSWSCIPVSLYSCGILLTRFRLLLPFGGVGGPTSHIRSWGWT